MPDPVDLRNLLSEEADAASRGNQRPLYSVVDLSDPAKLKKKEYRLPMRFRDRLIMWLDKLLTKIGA